MARCQGYVNPPSAVLFDIGGVVIRTPFEMLDRFERHHSVRVEWRGPFREGSDPPFDEVRAGRLGERDYWADRARELGLLAGIDPATAVGHLFRAPEAEVVRGEVLQLIDDLRSAGLRVGMLTNDLAKFHGPDWPELLPSIAGFHPLVDLSHRGTLKPHPDAYRLGVEALGVSAGDVLFVDDQPVNVAGAVRAGLRAVAFDVLDPQASVSAIRRACGIA